MNANERLARKLLAGKGAVGMRVQPYRVGATVQPHYVGAPAARVPNAQGSPIQYSGTEYLAGDVTFIGFGQTVVLAGAVNAQITINVLRPFTPQKMFCPSTIVGLLVNNVAFQGTNIFANNLGVPIEQFSEVSTFPQIVWPTIDPATGVVFTVSNPTGGNLNFEGGMYGTDVRL